MATEFTPEYMRYRYNQCLAWAEAKANEADAYRATTPATWISRTARAQAIREAQNEAEVFYLSAQQYAQESAQ